MPQKSLLYLFLKNETDDLIERKWFWLKKQHNNNKMIIAHWNESRKDDVKLIEYSDDKILLKDLEKKKILDFYYVKSVVRKILKM
ncbi:MAG: hypothetical protein LBS81_03515 [Endomicrobium sp.]|nr:hypothetical protein [Endomicrobium sp.]